MSVLDVYEGLQENEYLRFRPWYPNIDSETKQLLETKEPSEIFEAKRDDIRKAYSKRLNKILDTYNQQMNNSETEYEKLLAISKVVRDSELLHPFPDGNGRTFPVLLMNHLLTYHGFIPVIFRDPNIDAELSYAEFVLDMKKGMETTLQLLKDPQSNVYNFSIKELSASENSEFLHHTTQLVDIIEQFDKSEQEPRSDVYLNTTNIQEILNGRWSNLYAPMSFDYVGYYNTFRPNSIYFAMAVSDWEKDGKNVLNEFKRVLKRAKAIVTDREEYAKQLNVPVFLVSDIEKAFKLVSSEVRQKVDPQTVLITGTEGKTGAKIQLHHLLKEQTEVHANLNSANTEGPIFLSLANLKHDTKVEINEVSVGPHEDIRVMRAKTVNPNICLFTNIGPNHMDMHKSMENIIIAKTSVVEGLRPNGIAIVNAKNKYAVDMINMIHKRREDVKIFTYGDDSKNSAHIIECKLSDNLGWEIKASIENELIEYSLPFIQKHAPISSLSILLTIKLLGYDIQQAANDYFSVKSFETMGSVYRLNYQANSVLFYDQSRRGGIHGMKSAFNDLKNLNIKGKVIALIGGISVKKDSDWTKESHTMLSKMINDSSIDRLYTTGSFMNYVHENLDNQSVLVKHSDDLNELTSLLIEEFEDEDLLFIIGSAYLYLGRVSEKILNRVEHIKLS